jgi:hypothetical protein
VIISGDLKDDLLKVIKIGHAKAKKKDVRSTDLQSIRRNGQKGIWNHA